MTTGKPLNAKLYGSIPHLSSSRLGPADHYISLGQEAILTKKKRDKHDLIVVTEKMDGSCVGVSRVNGRILALTRAGWPAHTSPYEHHKMFEKYVMSNPTLFDWVEEGMRLCGEWCALAHGTIYHFKEIPFFVFDLFIGDNRIPFENLRELCHKHRLSTVPHLHTGSCITVQQADQIVGREGYHRADRAEGFVYRCERLGKVDFLAKYVRHEKQDGIYLPEKSGDQPIWLYKL